MFSRKFNIKDVLLEEVALEGLDGITWSAFLLRLSTRHNCHILLDECWTRIYFDLLKINDQVEFFELEQPRDDLVIFNLKDFMDPVTKIYTDPDKDKIPQDIYPYFPVNDTEYSIQGSCLQYSTRTNITEMVRNMAYDEFTAEQYHNKIVCVASQGARLKYLFQGKDGCIPNNICLSLHAYCILERIGRSRHYGNLEITKELVNLSAKEIFYHRKDLLRYNLITRQHITKKLKTAIVRYNLLYLSKFHVEQISHLSNYMRVILEKLLNSPQTNYTLPIQDFSEIFGVVSSLSVKKLITYFRLDSKVKEIDLPYRTVYPDMNPKQWFKIKDKSCEKIANCLQLLDVNMNIAKVLSEDFETNEVGSEDEEEEADEYEEENVDVGEEKRKEEEEALLNLLGDTMEEVTDLQKEDAEEKLEQQTEESFGSEEDIVEETIVHSCLKRKAGYLDKNVPFKMSFNKQLFRVIEKAGPGGCSGAQIQNSINLQRSECRALLKHLPPYVHTYKKDEGRQRTQYFRLKKYENSIVLGKTKSEHELDMIPNKKLKPNAAQEDISAVNGRLLETHSLRVSIPDINLVQNNKRKLISSASKNRKKVFDLSLSPGKKISSSESTLWQENALDKSHSVDVDEDINLVNVKENQLHPNASGEPKPLNKLFISHMQLNRAQHIIHYLNEHKILSGNSTIQKLLVEFDYKQNYLVTIDRKTVLKIFDRLVANKYIKGVDLVLCLDKVNRKSIEKTVRVYLDEKLDWNDERLKMLIINEKSKYLQEYKGVLVSMNKSSKAVASGSKNLIENGVAKTVKSFKRKMSDKDVVGTGGEKVDGTPSGKDKTSANYSNDTKLACIQTNFSEIVSTEDKRLPLSDIFSTELMLLRVSDVLDKLKEKRTVAGYRDILNHVCKEDEKRKYLSKLDKRTLVRMLNKLVVHNYIKRVDVTFQLQSESKQVEVFTCLDVQLEDRDFLLVIEKEKRQFWTETNSVMEIDHSKENHQVRSKDFITLPKFLKTQKIHKLVFYIAYMGVEPLPDQNQARLNLQKKVGVEIPSDHPLIYNDTELNMFTFLPRFWPPMGCPQGFISFDEFYVNIPIRCLMHCLRLSAYTKDLEYFYFHPVKQYYPLRETSPTILKSFTRSFSGRKNVSSIFDVISNLACLGLVQFGKKLGQEKDNFIFYVNRRATLLNTLSSKPAYLQLDPKQTFPTITFEFESVECVEKYWMDAGRICLGTNLNSKSSGVGQKLTIYKKLRDKPDMERCCAFKDDVAAIVANDDGSVPGDRLGAAGFDSATHAHLKRNWSVIVKDEDQVSGKLDAPKVVKLSRGLRKPSKLFKNMRFESVKKPAFTERIVKVRPPKSKRCAPKLLEKSLCPASSIRRYRQNIKWTANDRDILHISHYIYTLFKVKPCHRLTRDVLVKLLSQKHLRCKVLMNYYRRILKIPENKERGQLLQCEMKHVDEVREYLLEHMRKHRDLTKKNKEEAVQYFLNVYSTLVSHIFNTLVVNAVTVNRKHCPLTYEDFVNNYCIVSKGESLEDLFPVPNNNTNIQILVLTSLIHSSLACGTDDEPSEQNLSLKLFHAYQKYSEPLIHRAVRVLKKNQILASTKYANASKQQTHSFSRYKLSMKYFFKLSLTEFQINSFRLSYEEYKTLVKESTKESSSQLSSLYKLDKINSGCLQFITCLLDEDFIRLQITPPNTLLLIDPKIENLDVAYKKVLDKYYRLVDKYKVGTMNKCTSRDYQDEEDEEERGPDNVPPMNFFNASRLAMYSLRDILSKEKINIQHCQRLLTLNSCELSISHVEPNMEQFYETFRSHKFIEELQDSITIPDLTYEQILSSLQSNIEKQIVAFIEGKGERGATVEQIGHEFGIDSEIKSVLDTLVGKHILVRLGCVSLTYVHNRFTTPWLLKTYADNDRKDIKDIVVMPWVRVDGTVNKRVLDYMLAVTLSHILFNPGITLLALQENFVAVLQPVHVTFLVEILHRFECVTLQVATMIPPTLFSKSYIKLSPATGLESAGCLHLEGLSSASLKLGMFIGDKAYAKDYLEDVAIVTRPAQEQTDVDKTQPDIDDTVAS